MKKYLIAASMLALLSCNNEPKLNQTEENKLEDQIEKDEAAMDSLEHAIMSQMDSIDIDTSVADPD